MNDVMNSIENMSQIKPKLNYQQDCSKLAYFK